MSDNSAKVLSVTAVWVSTACLFIFGICKMNWNGYAVVLLLLVSFVICVATAYATKKICDVYATVKDRPESD